MYLYMLLGRNTIHKQSPTPGRVVIRITKFVSNIFYTKIDSHPPKLKP